MKGGALLQEAAQPDLAKWLPWWVPYVAFLAVAAWKSYQLVRRGKQAESDEEAAKIAKAVRAEHDRAELAESVAALWKDKATRLEADGAEKDRKIEKLEAKAKERAEIEEELQQKVMSLRARIIQLEKAQGIGHDTEGAGG